MKELRGIRLALERLAVVQEAKARIEGTWGPLYNDVGEDGSEVSYLDEAEVARKERLASQQLAQQGTVHRDWGKEREIREEIV